jgi:mono/diheme cytochrome c family protein
MLSAVLYRLEMTVTCAQRHTLFIVILLTGGCGRPPLRFPLARTPARLARGKYLVNAVATCFHCHSERDWQTPPGGLPAGGRLGAGRVLHPGFRLTFPNITPDRETGAGTWSDEDFYRAMTRGIGHDGRTLYTEMPYCYFSKLADEDLASMIVYVRSLPPIYHPLPNSEIPAAVRARLKPLPERAAGFAADLSTPEKRGAYLTEAAACTYCHTPKCDLEDMTKLEWAGGVPFEGDWGSVASANLTPDPSGIPYYDERMIRGVIRTGMNGARKINPVMPWPYLRAMTDADIHDIFAYLRTLPPVQHHVDNAEAVSLCKKCGNRHGLGDMN